MFVKKMDYDFTEDCLGKIFRCTKSNVNFYEVGALYKIVKNNDYLVLSRPNNFEDNDGWNGLSGEFVEVVLEEQLSLNFSLV